MKKETLKLAVEIAVFGAVLLWLILTVLGFSPNYGKYP